MIFVNCLSILNPIQPYQSSKPFLMIHSDIWGPHREKNVSVARWFVTFIDDHSRVCWVFLMKQKSDVQIIIPQFYKMVEAKFQTKIQILRTDNGREYVESVLGNFLKEKGIVHQSSCISTPQQNGMAERKNRHLLETARSLLFTHNIPKSFWGKLFLLVRIL